MKPVALMWRVAPLMQLKQRAVNRVNKEMYNGLNCLILVKYHHVDAVNYLTFV